MDPDQRAEYIKQMQAVMYEDCPGHHHRLPAQAGGVPHGQVGRLGALQLRHWRGVPRRVHAVAVLRAHAEGAAEEAKSSSSSTTLAIVAAAAVVVVVLIVVFVLMRRRGGHALEE